MSTSTSESSEQLESDMAQANPNCSLSDSSGLCEKEKDILQAASVLRALDDSYSGMELNWCAVLQAVLPASAWGVALLWEAALLWVLADECIGETMQSVIPWQSMLFSMHITGQLFLQATLSSHSAKCAPMCRILQYWHAAVDNIG